MKLIRFSYLIFALGNSTMKPYIEIGLMHGILLA